MVQGSEEGGALTDQGREIIHGKNVVAVMSFHDTLIYATDADMGPRPERVVAPDPHGRFHKVHHKAGNPSGTYEEDSPPIGLKLPPNCRQRVRFLF